MLRELLHIGPLTVYTYGLMIAIGILAAYYLAEKRAKKTGLSTANLEGLTFSLLIGGFIGSKLLYYTTRFQDILADPSILFDFANGWVVYGGILGGLAGGWIYCHVKKMNFWQYCDLIIPEVALAQGFGRIGCFMAGCCYGIETDAWYGVVFPPDSLAPSGPALVPVQLIMSAFDFLLFFILLYLAQKKTFEGEVCGWYLIIYSAGRFAVEYLRGDLIRGGIGQFSTSQIISIFTIILGLVIVFAGRWYQTRKQIQKA